MTHRSTLSSIVLGSGLVLASLAGGCAQQSPPPVWDIAQHGVSAGALCFDPAVAQDQIAPDMSREGRVPQIVLGYQQQQISAVDVWSYDRQTNRGDTFYRETFLENTSTLSR